MQSVCSLGSAPFFYFEGTPPDALRVLRRMEYGLDLICVAGSSEIVTGLQTLSLSRDTELILLPGTLFRFVATSDDFCMRMFLFGEELFQEAALPMDPMQMLIFQEFPFYHHLPDSAFRKEIDCWMDMARIVAADTEKPFGIRIVRNFLQSYLMWISHRMPAQYASVVSGFTRRQLLYHRFLALVHRYGGRCHDVPFYAEKLCVSTRYLSRITADFAPGKTPKRLIDEQVIAEVKVLLHTSDLSVTEIADRLNFPDQSYLSRYFRRQTGISPGTYRKQVRQDGREDSVSH